MQLCCACLPYMGNNNGVSIHERVVANWKCPEKPIKFDFYGLGHGVFFPFYFRPHSIMRKDTIKRTYSILYTTEKSLDRLQIEINSFEGRQDLYHVHVVSITLFNLSYTQICINETKNILMFCHLLISWNPQVVHRAAMKFRHATESTASSFTK